MTRIYLFETKIDRQMHRAFLRARCQARFRNESWDLTVEQFQMIWRSLWNRRGRSSLSMCMTRIDRQGPWATDNVCLITRAEQITRQKIALGRIKNHESYRPTTYRKARASGS